MKTAKAWHKDPLQWRALPPDDQARMMGFELFEGTREAYDSEWREEYHKKHGDKGDAGDREFKAMQRAAALKRRGLM